MMRLRPLLPGLRRRLREERGYSLVELLAAMSILGLVVGALTTLFVSASAAQIDLDRRLQSQQAVLVAMSKLRREIHCAQSISPFLSNSITLSLPSQCITGTGSVSWCTWEIVPGERYELWREVGATCDNVGGVRWADYLTEGAIFAYVPQDATSLAKLRVELPVNVNPSNALQTYELEDDIVLRNGSRT
jgi:prepilin-type N-terminal cleavage/methylation domain-containing protein